MKKYLIIFLLWSVVPGCRKNANEPEPKEQLKATLSGNFKAVRVRENSVVVFEETSVTNIFPGYERYKMEFTGQSDASPRVRFTEYTGEVFEGSWEIIPYNPSDPESFKLKLSNLSPQPTESNGIIEFQILSWTTGFLELKAVKSNPKTGDSVNEYRLKKI